MDTLEGVRNHVVALLRGGQAYETFEQIIGGFPADRRGVVPPGSEHSRWQILEHMRITQRDILDFSRNEDGSYQEKRWPEEYWPKDPAPPQDSSWDETVKAFLADRSTLESLVRDPNRDLFARFPWGDGQTLLREALLAADHQSYHLGQLVTLQRLLE